MKLSSLFGTEQVILNVEARTVRAAIPELLTKAGEFSRRENVEMAVEAVLHRQEQAPTALGRGIAVPHARIPGLSDYYLIIGRAAQPLEDTCLDGTHVELIFLVLANDQKNVIMLQTLSAISQLGLDDERRTQVLQASTPDAVWEAIDEGGFRVREALTARDLVTKAAFVLSPGDSLHEALDHFFEHRCFEAPVIEKDARPVGVVTAKEIIEAGFPDYLSRMANISFLSEFQPFEQFFKREETTFVRDIMNKKPLVADVDDPLIQVVFRMKKERQRYACVTENGRYVGAINRNDIISKILRA